MKMQVDFPFPELDGEKRQCYHYGEFGGETMDLREITLDTVRQLLPTRDREAHKGMFGKILLLCGSRGYTGAAALAAMAALRSGAGLVYLGVPESIYSIMAVKLTEPIVFPLEDEDGKLSSKAVPQILNLLPQMDAVLAGPGLGQSKGVYDVVSAVLQNFAGPVVVDADGINVLQKHMDIVRGRTAPVILTPHMGEFLRAGGKADADRMDAAVSFAKQWNCVLLLKGHNTIITDGTVCYRNTSGNPGMAVGGSGDVLSGMIASFLGQKMEPLEAAACGAWLHGRSGDICAEEIGEYGMLPSDIIQVLPRLLK